MTSKRTLWRVLLAVMLSVAFLSQVTTALAGTTGGISGTVSDTHGKPIAGASVKAVSASQVATATTDAGGHFVFLSLAPDTYTMQIHKDGYQDAAVSGISIFADQTQVESFTLEPALKTIATVTSTAAGALVKQGVGSDLYNVNASQIAAAGALGGGANLNSAYSAIASVPGVNVPIGGSGWNQATYIRGSQSFFSGFEYDGIPVNRAFDNYNASTESNLGLQELEVYTGGGPASNASSGTSGFINQVIKTGTYPGYLDLQGGIAGPTFYHQGKVELGGASQDRRFSYYIGLSGYNQDFRTLNNQDGANLETPGNIYASNSIGALSNVLNGVPRTEAPQCNPGTNVTPSGVTSLPWWSSEPDVKNPIWGYNSDCYIWYQGNYGQQAQIMDRENVANIHYRIPHGNGLSDDIQLLWSASALNTQYAAGANDAGGYGPYTLAVTGMYYCPPSGVGGQCSQLAAEEGGTAFPNYPSYVDAKVYNAPFGTPIAGLTLQNYYQPTSNPNRSFDAELPANLWDGIFNDTGIVKLQYTHQLNENAYVRAFGYTFFSDWNQAGSESAWNCYEWGLGPLVAGCGVAANYDLITHTAGGELQFADQLNNQNLLELTGNYSTANVVRFNNEGYTGLLSGGVSPIGLISYNGGTFSCWDPTTGAAESCAPGNTYESNAANGPTGTPPAGSPAAAAKAQWVTLWNGNSSGSYNTVAPKFTDATLSDQWRPSDKLLFNAAVRFENYEYGLDASGGEATDFYAQIVQQDVCINPAGTVYTKPLAPGEPPPAPVIYTSSCPTGYAHPSFSANSPTSYTLADVSPRFSMTYTESPDTVWRLSAGRFTEPPISASVQYLSNSGNELSVWNATLPLGFNSPFHPIPAMSATQVDGSLERHIRGTDVSFKLTPFFNLTKGYQEQSFIGPNFVTQAPVGQFASTGVELSLQKGDFNRDGLSGQFNITYTDAMVQYQYYYGINQIATANTAIQQYNLLTKAGGGCPYYNAGACVAAGSAPPATAILNPYYNNAPQPLLNPNGWYAPADTGLSPTSNPSTTYYDSPLDATLILNYRKQRWAITPSLQLAEGASYGGPMDVVGEDPRTCGANSATMGITAVSPNTNPYQCDALQAAGTFSTAAGDLFIPNPQTGTFASPGEYRDPWILEGNLQMSYQISAKVSANLTLANVFHTCFGGSAEPWTKAFAPGPNICGYGVNSFYIGNFYNGTGPYDKAANGFTPYDTQTNSYGPSIGSDAGFIPSPFNAYLTLNVRI